MWKKLTKFVFCDKKGIIFGELLAVCVFLVNIVLFFLIFFNGQQGEAVFVIVIFGLPPLLLIFMFQRIGKLLETKNTKQGREYVRRQNQEVSYWGNMMSFLFAAVLCVADVLICDSEIKTIALVIGIFELVILLFVSRKYAEKVWDWLEGNEEGEENANK